MEIKIIYLSGTNKDQVLTYSEDVKQKISIGRHPSSDIVFADRTSAHSVSRRHAEILFRDEAWRISDLQSTNGTFVNGVQIREETELRNSDTIGFGDEEPNIRVEISSDFGSDKTDVIRTIPRVLKKDVSDSSPSKLFSAFAKAMERAKTGSGARKGDSRLGYYEERGLPSGPVGQKTLFMMISHAAQQASLQKRGRLGDMSIFMRAMVQQAVHESSRKMRMVLIGCGLVITLLIGWMIYENISRRNEEARLVGLLQTEYQSRLGKIQTDLNQEIHSWEQEKGAYERLITELKGKLNREQASGDTRRVRTTTRELESAVAQGRELEEKVNTAKKSFAAVQEKAAEELKTFSTEAQSDPEKAVEKARETLANLTTATLTATQIPEASTTTAAQSEPASTATKTETVISPSPDTAAKIAEFPTVRISRPFGKTSLKKRIGIAPISMPSTTFANVEKNLPDLLATILFNSGEFIIVPYTDKPVQGGMETSIQEVDPAKPPQVVIKISVTDIREETTQSSRSLGFLYFNVDIGSVKSISKIMLDIKAFDFASSSLLLSRSLIGEGVKKKSDVSPRVESLVKFSKMPGYGGGGYQGIPPSVVDAMWKVIAQMADIVLTHLHHESWRGLVLKSTGENVVISGGNDTNMKVGDTFIVFAKEPKPAESQSEPSMFQRLERRVGTLRVEDVAESYSIARVVDREEPEFRTGYSIKYTGVTKILAPGESEDSIPASEVTADSTPKRLLRIIDKNAKPRLDPIPDASELKDVKLKQGDLLKWEFSIGEWYKVTLDEKRSGWLHASQIEISEDKTSKPK